MTVAVNDLATLDLLARAVSAAFLFAFGACTGSFLNVVAYRLPEGLSVIHPPSRCPTCGGRLAWRDNLPILGWLFLRGKCRFCREPISPQYPLVEAFTATLFAGLYLVYFALPPREPLGAWLGGATPWWHAQGFAYAWPAFVALLGLVSGLIAATLADLRTFLIPQPITRTVTVVALAAWAVQPWLGLNWRAGDAAPPIPVPAWPVAGAALGGLAGTLVALGLKRFGVIPESFADWAEHVKEGDAITSYPHARREMRKEAAFLLPVLLGTGIGWFAVRVAADGGRIDPAAAPPAWLGLPAASALGFLVAGGWSGSSGWPGPSPAGSRRWGWAMSTCSRPSGRRSAGRRRSGPSPSPLSRRWRSKSPSGSRPGCGRAASPAGWANRCPTGRTSR